MTAPSVAIKEIQEKKVFIREKINLQRIKDLGHEHLIKLIASVENGVLPCFIFPWAEGGNLWEFWQREDSSPRTNAFILWLLKELLGLIDAVRVLHERNIRHGAIKPQSILHFTSPLPGKRASQRGTLVLASVGVSKAHSVPTGLRNAGTNTVEVTILYEAPEAEYEWRQDQPRSRSYDIWATGCTLLDLVVWLLYGFGAVMVFRRQRISNKDDPTVVPGNFFREKKGQTRIHPKVKMAIKLLRNDPRCAEGTAMSDLLDLIEARLLRIDPRERAKASELHDKLQDIVNRAQRDHSYLWRASSTSPEIPKFFVRKKSRQNSDFSAASSGSSASD